MPLKWQSTLLLSLVFPLYLFLLVALLIAASHCTPMHKVHKRMG